MKKISVLSTLILTSVMANAESSNIFLDNIDFRNYEVQAELGLVDANVSCDTCDMTTAVGGGLSTNHNKPLFMNLLMRQDSSFKYRNGNEKYDLDSFSLNTNLNYNFLEKQNYNLYGSVGASFYKNKTIGINANEVYSSSKYYFSPVIGLGAMYDINDVVSVGVKYEHKFNVKGTSVFNVKDMNQDLYFLTLNVKIPQFTKIIKEEKIIENTVVIEKETSLFFDINKSETEKLENIDEILSSMQKHKHKNYVIYVNAHASKIGDDEYNLNLSEKRAEFVKSKIIEKLKQDFPNISDNVIVNHYGYNHHSDNSESSQRVDINISFF